MENFLRNKKIIITGGNKGIGRAIALAFAQHECDIVITYNSDPDAADTVIKEINTYGVRAQAIKVNLLNPEERRNLVKEGSAFLGDIDILVNNAGIATRKSVLELTEEEVNQVFAVNVLGPFFLTQAVGKYMRGQQQALIQRNSELTDRCIINISSLSRQVVTPGLAHYELSKAAVSQMSKSVAMDEDFRKYRIRVNDVAPGLIPTNINASQWQTNTPIWQQRVAAIPLGRPGKPEEIAQAVIAVASNAWMTGTTLMVDGGRSANWSGADIAA